MQQLVWYDLVVPDGLVLIFNKEFGCSCTAFPEITGVFLQGPLFEGVGYYLEHAPILPGPLVIPFKSQVTFLSGTSSLQGNIHRKLLVELATNSVAQHQMSHRPSRFAWIVYSLQETTFTITGPASALQVLQVRYIFFWFFIKSHLRKNRLCFPFLSDRKMVVVAQAISRHVRQSVSQHFARAEV
jgi:hypothetical protein